VRTRRARAAGRRPLRRPPRRARERPPPGPFVLNTSLDDAEVARLREDVLAVPTGRRDRLDRLDRECGEGFSEKVTAFP
jgi:hypothetical protein